MNRLLAVACCLISVASLAACDDGPRFAPAQLEVDRTVIQFDDVAVGYPRIEGLLISNPGGVALVLQEVAVVGEAASPFEVLGMRDQVSGEIVELPNNVGPKATIEVLLRYDPPAEDSEDFDTLRIATNDADECPSQYNPCEIQLNGNGAPPDAELEVVCRQDEACPGDGSALQCRPILDGQNVHPLRVALNFCEVAAGHSRQLDAELRNIGNIPLTMNGFVFDAGIGDPADFRLLAPSSQDITIEPGQHELLSVLYAPDAEGVDNSGIDVQTNDDDLTDPSDNPLRPGVFKIRMLAYSAEPDIDVNPLNIPFQGVSQGGSATETMRVHNRGSGVLAVEAPVVSGGSLSGEFTVSPTTAFEVQPGGQATLDVTYSPQDSGADDGSVILRSNDPDEGQVVVTLGGEVRPDLDSTPADIIPFANVPTSGSATADVTLRNVGYADLTLTRIELTNNPGDPPVFELLGLPGTFPGTPIVLAPTETVGFQVKFTDNPFIADEFGQVEIDHDSPSDSQPYILLAVNTGTAANLPPVAVIDPPSQVVNGLQSVSLSGANSFDPDAGDSISRYSWSFLFLPADAQGNVSTAVLDSTDGQTTSFTPDMIGKYVVRLVVFDTFNIPSQAVDSEISVNP